MIGLEVAIYLTIIITMLVVFAIWIYFEVFKYKHTVIIRELANNRKFIIRDKACIITDSNKTVWWKLKKEKDKIKKLMPTPPPESIELTKRGKKWVEAYRTDNGEYIFIQDTAKINDIPQEVLDEIENIPDDIKAIQSKEVQKLEYEKRKNMILKKWREENNIIKPLKPFSTNQRIALVNGIKKAEIRKRTDWKQNIGSYVMGGAGLLIILMLIIMAPDIITTYTEGATQISNSIQSYEKIRHDNLLEEQKNWDKISQGIQTIHNVQLEQQQEISELKNGK